MKRLFRSSLRFRMLLPFLLSLAPILALMLYSASLQRRLVAAEVQENWQNFTRLAAVKAKYDPGRLFSFPQAVLSWGVHSHQHPKPLAGLSQALDDAVGRRGLVCTPRE